MKKQNLAYALTGRFIQSLLLLLLIANANAAVLSPLEVRLNGKAYFDPNLNITWLANADLVGETTLAGANSGLASLVVEGVSGWRLPLADINNDGVAVDCKGKTVDTCSTDNELSFMLNIRGVSAAAPGPFGNLRADWYWTLSDAPYNLPRVYAWQMNDSSQSGLGDAHPDNVGLRTWAVYDGDVAVVPVPAAVWLFGSGLLGLVGFSMRRVS